MNSQEILERLNQEQEMIPDAHDGSYALMREIIKSYATVTDYSSIDYKDLNAVYAMAIGTWKMNVEIKRKYVDAGHLSVAEKERLKGIINKTWDNACYQKYENREGEKPSIGMFGTGFFSFEGKADNKSCQRFIKLMTEIAPLNDDDMIFDLCEKVFDSNFKGMQAAAASVMLHCLKPNTFPVLNANFGDGTVFEPLGIALDKPGRIETYIGNCRKIKAFRDAKLPFKNYRILDRFPRKYKLTDSDEFGPSLDEFDPGLTAEEYHDLFLNEEIVKPLWLEALYELYQMPNHLASCKQLGDKYGHAPAHYISYFTTIAERIAKETNCPLLPREEEDSRYWPVLFLGKRTSDPAKGTFIWKMREPVVTAMEMLIEEGVFDTKETSEMKAININTILYGPPGTGKTYNTVLYAVAIIENKTFEEISKEALIDYPAIKSRYDLYKKEERVAFVTFHQSYGYEEFIEGIKPIVDNDNTEESTLEYSIESGVFKKFCEKAAIPRKKDKTDYGLNASPVVWKISLEKAGDNPTRRECLDNGHIRIGWDKYGPEISDETFSSDEHHGGMAQLNAFINKMKIGDIVLSCYSSTQIDAIGIITGDYEWDDTYDGYNRLRKVKWLVKDIREDIIEANGGTPLVQSTVYKLKIPVRDVLDIVNKFNVDEGSALENNKDNYVFVIDEINRGNISKIFGELITLIEENKRRGAIEEATAKLPYSHESFGVPSNVYILGTMNTADRSIAIMDTALRRRFSFVEMLPDSDVLRQLGNPTIKESGVTVNVADMLDVINERITFLYDREHTIGHAFFMPLISNPSVGTLAMIFEKSIIPLLQEYFYEDYAKIQLVLGDDGKTGDKKQYQFILDEDMDANKIFETVQELDSEKKYTINYPAFREIESYKYISKKL